MTDPLLALGRDERVEALAEEHVSAGLTLGRVVRVDRGQDLVVTADGPIRAEPSTAMQATADGAEALPAVGDWVVLRLEEGLDVALVEAVLDRWSALVRRDPKEATVAQVLAANVDTVFIVHTLANDPNVARIERELVVAWESGAQPVVVLNKSDLHDDPEGAALSVEAVAPGVPVLVTDAIDGAGIEEVAKHIGAGRTAVFLGPSGAGKSTLINQLADSNIAATGDVREGDQKGRHTTVARELFELPVGGLVIDTPGLRALALWDAEDGLALAFSDIDDLAARCKFRDCRHQDEPGCAVKAAVDSGELTERRLASYRGLVKEMEYLDTRKDVRARTEKARYWKQVSRSLKDHPKYKKGRD